MARLAVLFAAALALWLLPAPSQAQKEGLTDSPYFPLKVGTRWEYRIGQRKVSTRVVRHEKIDQQWCARLETRGDGDAIVTEYIGVKKDGIYRFRANGLDVLPPLCLCKLPPLKGTRWEVQARTAAHAIRGNFVVVEEAVTVGKTTYPQALVVTCPEFKVGGEKSSLKTWYVHGVGMVKQELKTGEADLLIELESFEAGK